jgi:hypothetical protein
MIRFPSRRIIRKELNNSLFDFPGNCHETINLRKKKDMNLNCWEKFFDLIKLEYLYKRLNFSIHFKMDE